MTRRSYNHELKIAAAKLARETGCSVRKAAKSLGVDEVLATAILDRLCTTATR